jgi:hypothetical protein
MHYHSQKTRVSNFAIYARIGYCGAHTSTLTVDIAHPSFFPFSSVASSHAMIMVSYAWRHAFISSKILIYLSMHC